jgi:hypothetical protein
MALVFCFDTFSWTVNRCPPRYPGAGPGKRTKPPPAITGCIAEIQPHQSLIGILPPTCRSPGMPESVDAAKCSLYKGGHGGGRNLAAAVL